MDREARSTLTCRRLFVGDQLNEDAGTRGRSARRRTVFARGTELRRSLWNAANAAVGVLAHAHHADELHAPLVAFLDATARAIGNVRIAAEPRRRLAADGGKAR